jgi:hypothetical protein
MAIFRRPRIADERGYRNKRFISRLADQFQIRMGSRRQVQARPAIATRFEVGFRVLLAKQGLGQLQREGAFANPRRTDEQKRAGEAPTRGRTVEGVADRRMLKNFVPTHRGSTSATRARRSA